MLAPLSWIKEFAPVNASPEALAEKLSMAGLEVEALQSQGAALDQVFSATILKMDKHPNADKLTLCEVQCGEEVLPVVCGAKNMQAGDKVALARPGAKLPNGLKIKASKIRGEKSEGMLCSKSELGLAEESEGILILPADAANGAPLAEVLGQQDTVLEVNVTPNRGDCLSMIGLAREVAANYGLELQNHSAGEASPKPSQDGGTQAMAAKDFAVELKAKACSRYTARVLRGVKVGSSSQKITQRLQACGIRPINNVVDATNYVMLETGQPLHAFDLQKLSGGLEVRMAAVGEKLTTLEGQECELSVEDLVIADHKGPVALAGVMGGASSGVEEGTVDLLLESACFAPSTVRRTAKRLGIATDSSYRFERGVDVNGCAAVLERLAVLIMESAGGALDPELADLYPQPLAPETIELRASRLQQILGVSLEEKNILPPLAALGIDGKKHGKNQSEEVYELTIPTFRPDLTREIDVIEEVARLYGYDQIPTHYPRLNLAEIPSRQGNRFERLDEIRHVLRDWGFSEALHYSFTSPQLLEELGAPVADAARLSNPLSEELSVMRPALFPQMLKTVQQNSFRGAKHLKLFELRPVYEASTDSARPLQESWHLCLALAGTRRPEHFLEKDEQSADPVFKDLNILDLKGYMNRLMGWLGVSGRLMEAASEASKAPSWSHPGQYLSWQLKRGKGEGSAVGLLAKVHPKILKNWDMERPVILGEIKLDNFLTESKNRIQFQEISPFPTVGRDLNLVVDENIPHGEIAQVLRSQGGPWLKQVGLFDVYRGQPLPGGKKALTYRLDYGSEERTLTDEEVNGAREKLLNQLQAQLGVTLR